MKIATSWSGGKDSCYAMLLAMREGHQPLALLNVMNELGQISRSHGLPLALLQQQAQRLNLPLVTVASSWQDYEPNFVNLLKDTKEKYQIEGMVFGDIDLQAHRDWEEKVCEQAGLAALLPLWKNERTSLVHEMLRQDFACLIVSCEGRMGERFLGRTLTAELVRELETMGIDPCGENGEFHTLVVNCPLFTKPLELPGYQTANHEGYWFVQWE
jgi:uncharacterized protein (TIGR00290 family)